MTTAITAIGPDQQAVLEAIERMWGFRLLRPLQEEAIDAGLTRCDSLVVLPTGGGKSLCYQAPALVADRLDVVVSPLISLMKDQVDSLQANGYPAEAIHSGLNDSERRDVAQRARSGELRLLFVAPERLVNASFLDFLDQCNVSSFAIDEAHCISQWGHDFRPEYRRLAELRSRFPDAALHAFTATATERVREDIAAQLGLRDARVLVGDFDRPNLVYRMVPRVSVRDQILEVALRHRDEAAIVYCISRNETERIAAFLKSNGIDAAAYHAGLETPARKRVQEAFAREDLNVVVATVAFGMGIDRSNVRCVVHAAMPKSIEHYQQETGRAGRDSLEAECVLFFSHADVIRWEQLIERSAAEAREPAEVISAARELLGEMQRLASGTTCRHRALVEYFGQSYEKPDCGACDVCLDEVDVVPDSTTVAQKIISCVARVQQRFGVGHVADVLTGSKAELVVKCGHDQLSVYGLLSNMSKKQVTNLTHQLVDQDLLARTPGDRPVVTLNDRSSAVLQGDEPVRLVQPPREARRTKVDAESWEGVDRGLFDRLRELRQTIARERNVPAYVIFGDATLRDLARRRPSTIEAIAHAYGVGVKKREDLGPLFVEAVVEFCNEHEIDMDCVPAPPPRSRTTGVGNTKQKEDAFAHFRKGESIDTVAEAVGRAPSTTLGYLIEFITQEKPESVETWVSSDIHQRVAASVDRVGAGHLRPIHDDLNGEIPYDFIKIVVAHMG